MARPPKVLLVFFNGKSNAGGAERMVSYFDDYLQSRELQSEIVDEKKILGSIVGKWYSKLFNYRHFKKRRTIYMGRFTSAYLWFRKRPYQFTVSNGEATPFFPVDLVICQGCYHTMEKAYGRQSDELSRISKLQQRGISISKKVIAVTNMVKKDLINIYGIDASKISVIANRVDTDYFPPKPRTVKNIKTVLYAGRLEEGKGLADVIKLSEIIEKSQGWKLIIACNNDFNTHLFQNKKNTQLKIGLTLYNMNDEAYSQADIVIFPSHYESFGMITIEALSAGVPVIATPVGIIPEMAERKFPGVYVLQPFSDEKILTIFDNIITEFSSVDRNKLHEQVKEEFGILSYRKELDKSLTHLFNLSHLKSTT